MIRAYDLKQKKAVELNDREALNAMTLHGDRFVPVRDDDYVVLNKGGDAMEVKGQDLMAALGDGGELMDPQRFHIRKQLEAENSQVGQFLKGMANEALTLGMVKETQDNPWEQMVEEERVKMFGRAEGAGRIAGNILPFLAGGVGGILSQGAKTGVKAVAGKTLKGIGKYTPSSAIIRGAVKSGDKAADMVKGLGYGAGLQGVARATGSGLAFAGAEAASEGIGQGIQQAAINKRKREFPGHQEAGRKMDSAVGEGFKRAGQVFTETSVLMAALGVGGKVVGIGAKGVAKGASWTKKGLEKAGEKARESFLGVRRTKDLQILDRAFDPVKEAVLPKPYPNVKDLLTGKKTLMVGDPIPEKSKKQVFQNVVNYLSESGKVPKTKDEAIKLLTVKDKNLSTMLKRLRTSPAFNQEINAKNVPFTMLPQEFYKKLRGLASDVELTTDLRPFALYLRRLEQFTQNNTLKLSDLFKISQGFAENAKFGAGEVQKKVHKVFRKAYRMSSDYEDLVLSKIQQTHLQRQPFDTPFRKDLQKILKDYSELSNTKREFEKNKTVLDLLNRDRDRMFSKGLFSLGDFYLGKDIAFISGAAGLGAGLAGGPLAGIGAAVGIAVGGNIMKRTGYRMLQLANLTDNAHQVMSLVKTPKGIQSVLNGTSKAFKTMDTQYKKIYNMDTAKLSQFMLGRTYNNFEEFNRGLLALDDVDRLTQGTEDLFGMVDLYGGEKTASSFNRQVIGMKQRIMQRLPRPIMREPASGKLVYDQAEKRDFYNTLNQGMSVAGFLKAFKNSELSRDGVMFFKENYPDFYDDFLQSLYRMPDEHPAVQHFLNLARPVTYTSPEMIYYQMDAESNAQGQAQSRSAGGQTAKRKINVQAFEGDTI